MNRIRSAFQRTLAALATGALVACVGNPALPPLDDSPDEVRLPGKFVWADLFTSDLSGARRFYGELFDWEWRWISRRPGHRYGIFYNEGAAVAGIAEVESPDADKTYSRWVHYISVLDVTAAAAAVDAWGGRTMLPPRDAPERGRLAILADPEDAPFGVLRSSSGDPPDYQAGVGQWLWIGLFAADAEAAARFYASLFGFDVHRRDGESKVLDFVLAASGYSRAGIAELGPESESHATWLGYVRVDDVDAALEKVRALDGEVWYAPDSGDARGEIAIVADPIGAPIGLLRWTYEDEAVEEARP